MVTPLSSAWYFTSAPMPSITARTGTMVRPFRSSGAWSGKAIISPSNITFTRPGTPPLPAMAMSSL